MVQAKTDKYKKGSARKEELDDGLVTMIAQDLQPLSIVKDDGFINFCHLLDKKYQMPCRNTIRNVLLPAKFEQVCGALKTKLDRVESVSVTTDLWTSNTNSSFMAVTGHFWDPVEDSLESCVLDCRRVHGRHTAQLIKEELEGILDEYNIRDKVLAVITDNGSNVVKAVKDISLRRLSCFAHSLNLVVMDSIKSCPALQETKEKVSKVVTLTKQSTVAKEKLDKIQADLGRKPKKLLQDVPTRWNSLYLMLLRFLELKDAVILFLAQSGMDKESGQFGSNHWEVIDQAVQLLKPCYEATVEMSGEKFATGSKLIPLTKMLMGYYAGEERDSVDGSVRKQISGVILRNLHNRFDVFEDVRIIQMATLLDPRFKNRCFRSAEKKKNAIALLNKELKERYEKKQLELAPPQERVPPPKQAKRDSLWDKFDSDMEQQVCVRGPLPDFSDVDLKNFFGLPCQPRQSDPLQWWSFAGKKRFPEMYAIATKYLSFPATSVPSERVFSSSGEIV